MEQAPIVLGSAALEALRVALSEHKYTKLFVLVDTHTAQYCWPIVQPYLTAFKVQCIEIPAGEAHKTLATCQKIWQALILHEADRYSAMINLGGGVVGDMGGFCAATFKRGMDFYQMPTSLLSQVDASIGGKLGVDFEDIKNGIGLFKAAQQVSILPDFLNTLPKRELYSGFAEMLKHSLIGAPVQWYRFLELLDTGERLEDWTTEQWRREIKVSLQVKKDIVAQDPYEKGLRKALNFGHTLGHALESLSWQGNTPLVHGEAVALGLWGELYLSMKYANMNESLLLQYEALLFQLYPDIVYPETPKEALIHFLKQDKKNIGGKAQVTLLQALSQVQVGEVISWDALESANRWMQKRWAARAVVR